MPNTYARVVVHVTFSTRFRRAWLAQPWEDALFAYMGGIVNHAGAQSLTVGGYRDHAHMLLHCPPKLALSNIVHDVKVRSTAWVHEHAGISRFGWQGGFGAFSVNHKAIPSVVAYIKRQRAHHERPRLPRNTG